MGTYIEERSKEQVTILKIVTITQIDIELRIDDFNVESCYRNATIRNIIILYTNKHRQQESGQGIGGIY